MTSLYRKCPKCGAESTGLDACAACGLIFAKYLQTKFATPQTRPRRPMDLAWVRQLRDKCRAAEVPFYFKQVNGLYPGKDAVLDGRHYREMPVVGPAPLSLFA